MHNIKSHSTTYLTTLAYSDADFRKYIDTIHSFDKHAEENRDEIEYLKASLSGLLGVYYDFTREQEKELYNAIDSEHPDHS